MFYVKRAVNRVLDCAITLILGNKWSLYIATYFFGMVILRKGDSVKASLEYFALFCTLKN